jgi:2-octaprenyl-6-methoxyphenol hydroxylase
MFIVPAEALRLALVEAVGTTSNVRFCAPASIVVCIPQADSVHVTLREGDAGTVDLRARLLIAADGRTSPVREMLGLHSLSWRTGQTGIVTTVRHERPHEGCAVQHFLPAGPFAILPLPDNKSCITWTEETETAQAILALSDDAFLSEVERRFGYKLGAVTLAGPRAAWPLEFQISRRLIASRVALIGDAARTVHPIAGQGFNLGLRDVAALAEVVADGMRLGLDPGDATGLERYERWRRFDSAMSSAAFGALNAVFSNDSTVLRGVRSVGLGAVDRLEGLKQLFVAEAAGLTGEVPRLLKGEAV